MDGQDDQRCQEIRRRDEDDDPENTDWEHKPVGEWVYEQFDMIPAQGESFTWHRLKVTVESIDHRRIRKLLIRLLPEETQEGGEEA